jgi:hypothetical protein
MHGCTQVVHWKEGHSNAIVKKWYKMENFLTTMRGKQSYESSTNQGWEDLTK